MPKMPDEDEEERIDPAKVRALVEELRRTVCDIQALVGRMSSLGLLLEALLPAEYDGIPF